MRAHGVIQCHRFEVLKERKISFRFLETLCDHEGVVLRLVLMMMMKNLLFVLWRLCATMDWFKFEKSNAFFVVGTAGDWIFFFSSFTFLVVVVMSPMIE